jgi:AcrR family transcriptional regulator
MKSKLPKRSLAVTPVRYRRQKGEGGLTRDGILKAASELLESAGRSSTALYFHFCDLDSILFEISDAIYEGLTIRFKRDAKRYPDPIRRVEAMMRSYALFGLLNPQAYTLAFIEPKKGHITAVADGKTSKADEALNVFGQAVHEAMQVHQDIERNAKNNAEKITHLLWFAQHGLVTMVIARPETLKKTKPSTLVKEMASLLVRGAFGESAQA